MNCKPEKYILTENVTFNYLINENKCNNLNTLIVGSRSLSDLYSYSSTYNDCKYIHTKSECFSYSFL